MAFVPSPVRFFNYYRLKCIFHVKIQLFCDFRKKPDQDPDPKLSGSAMVGSLIPDLYPHGDKKKLDPDPHTNKCGSTTLDLSTYRH
jgi:hypothetical protein